MCLFITTYKQNAVFKLVVKLNSCTMSYCNIVWTYQRTSCNLKPANCSFSFIISDSIFMLYMGDLVKGKIKYTHDTKETVLPFALKVWGPLTMTCPISLSLLGQKRIWYKVPMFPPQKVGQMIIWWTL